MADIIKQNLGDILKVAVYLVLGGMWFGEARANREQVKGVLLELNQSKLDSKVFETYCEGHRDQTTHVFDSLKRIEAKIDNAVIDNN